MSHLFTADQLCRKQCLASVGLHSRLMQLSGNIFAYGYSNTEDYAVKRYAIKQAYLAQKGCFSVLSFGILCK